MAADGAPGGRGGARTDVDALVEGIRSAQEPGDALINVLECLPEVSTLQGSEFDPLYFLDLCVGIEAAVLHGRLHHVGAGIPRTGSIARALHDEGVLRIHPFRAAEPGAVASDLLAGSRPRALLELVPRVIDPGDAQNFSRLWGYATTLTVEVAVETAAGIPLVVGAHGLPLYARLGYVMRDLAAELRATASLRAHYATIAQGLTDCRTFLNEIETIPVGPVALQVLDAARTPADLPEVVLDLRHKYARLRRYFQEREEVLSSTGSTLQQKLDALHGIKKAMASVQGTLPRTDDLPVLHSPLLTPGAISDVKLGADGLGVDDVSIGALLGTLMAKAPELRWRWRTRPLHAARRSYLRFSPDRFADVIARHFGATITPAAARQVSSYTAYTNRSLDVLCTTASLAARDGALPDAQG